MKRDKNLLIAILRAAEAHNLAYVPSFTLARELGMDDLTNDVDSGVELRRCEYHMMLLVDVGLLEFIPRTNKISERFRLTSQGHDYLDEIR